MSGEWSGSHSYWDQRDGPQAGGLRSEFPIGNQCLCEPVSFPAVPWRHGAWPQSFYGRRAVLPFKPGTTPPAGPSIIRAGATAITRGPIPSTTRGMRGLAGERPCSFRSIPSAFKRSSTGGCSTDALGQAFRCRRLRSDRLL